MTVEEQREVVRKKINDINDRILGVEKKLIIARVQELPDLTIKSIRKLIAYLDLQRGTLESISRRELLDLYEEYTYLLELEVEKSRGEDDKRRSYQGDEAQEDDPFGQKK